MTRARRCAAVVVAVTLFSSVLWSGAPARAAAPSVPISGTVRGHSSSPERTSALPGTAFAAATTSCADEERRLPAPNSTVPGVLLSVATDGTYSGLLVAGCSYDVRGVSLACSSTPQLSPITTVVANSAQVVHNVLEFGVLPALAPEPPQEVSPGTTLDLVDTSRAVDLWPCTYNATRSLPTTVILPDGPGPHPMVIVAHGLGGSRASMQGRGLQLAAAGYVAVIPSFASRQSNLATRDLPNQPGDVSFVLKEILRRNTRPLDPLYLQVNPDQIGISGVSGGAITALLLFNSCCRDPRIKAIHAELGFFLGAPLVSTPLSFKHRTPLLMANNRGDQLIPFANASSGWSEARADKFMVSEPANPCGQSHCLPVVGGIGLVEFFDAYLLGDATAKASLVATFSQPPADGVVWDLDLGGSNK